MNESCHTDEWVMSHAWVSSPPHMKEWWHLLLACIGCREKKMRHFTRAWSVMSDLWVSVCMRHVTLMNTPCQMMPNKRKLMSYDGRVMTLLACMQCRVECISHLWMSHVAGDAEGNACFMLHVWMSNVTRVNESCDTREWVMSHARVSHATSVNTSFHMGRREELMCHVTRVNESCHTWVWNMSCHVTGDVERNGWVRLHVWMSHVTRVNESCHRGCRNANETGKGETGLI